MGNLRGRVAAVGRALGSRGGDLVVVQAAFEGAATVRTPAGVLCLSVPWEHARDPHAGLSAEQRAAIRPGDQVITVEYVDKRRRGVING